MAVVDLEAGAGEGVVGDEGAEVLDRLDFIRRGQAAGLTLAQIGQVLDIRDRGQAPCRHVT
ncbi:MerR family DNA-binding protein, partial [Micrococcus luteus]|uniref:MerR family DNA-binding protein n=1 Tax=Micrococcus luteus TaxID=1270 RepID=UPI00333E5EA5